MKVKEIVTEGLRKAPTKDKHFDYMEGIFEKPLPAIMARPLIHSVLDDDDLNDRLDELAAKDPKADARPLISNWFELNMPDTLQGMKEGKMVSDGDGQFSPISGAHYPYEVDDKRPIHNTFTPI